MEKVKKHTKKDGSCMSVERIQVGGLDIGSIHLVIWQTIKLVRKIND